MVHNQLLATAAASDRSRYDTGQRARLWTDYENKQSGDNRLVSELLDGDGNKRPNCGSTRRPADLSPADRLA